MCSLLTPENYLEQKCVVYIKWKIKQMRVFPEKFFGVDRQFHSELATVLGWNLLHSA